MRWYTPEQLGSKQALTPEGYLVCLDVPVARTGAQIYRGSEIPVTPSADGFVRILRDPEEVFSPSTIASFNGKHVVNEHPEDMLDPLNWRQHAIGTVINPRRGEGTQEDNLLADFIIYDPQAIEDIRTGKREVSCGYDAEYKEIEPGRGRQFNIVGNHVALVTHGRCGSRCSIGDSAMPDNRTTMQRLRDAFTTKDEAAFTAAMRDMGALPDGSNSGSPPVPGPDAGAGQHRIIVNVHGGAKQDMGAGTDASVVPAGGSPPPATPAPASGAGGDVMQAIQALTQQVSQLCSLVEQALAPEDDNDDEFQTQSQSGNDPDIGAAGEEDIEEKMNPAGADDSALLTNERGNPLTMKKPMGDEGDLTEADTGKKVDGAMGKTATGGPINLGDEGDLTKAEETRKIGEPMGKTATGEKVNVGDAGANGSAAAYSNGSPKYEQIDKKTTKDGKKVKVRDSSALASEFTKMVSCAEIIMPGVELPTFDAAKPHTATMDSICRLQRRTLDSFARTPKGKEIIRTLINGTTFDSAAMDCDKLGVVFIGATELMKIERGKRMPVKLTKDSGASKRVPTIAEMNKANEEAWKARGGL